MARNIAFIGGERQVNFADLLDPSSGLIGHQHSPEVTALPNGHFVVVYLTLHESDVFNADLMWQEFDENGVRLDGPHRLDVAPDYQGDVDIAPAANGGFVAVWTDGNGFPDSIKLAIVAPGQTTEPVAFPVFDSGVAAEVPTVATLANGSYVVAYLPYESEHETNLTDIGLTIVTASGDAIINHISLAARDGVYERSADVAASGNNALVVWSEKDDVGGRVQLALVDATGTVLDREHVFDTGAELTSPSVATLSDGRLVVASSREDGVFARIYDPSARAFATDVITLSESPTAIGKPALVGLPDGGFLVSWTEEGPTPLHGRRFDAAGAPAGDSFLLNTSNGFLPALAINSAGTIFGVWSDDSSPFTTDPDTGVQGQFFTAVTETVNGTAGADFIQTYSLGETINGLEGDDIINAMGGNDTIDGGLGNDLLTGGAGADSFLFSTKLHKKTNVDTITDFSVADDTILLDNAIFKKLKEEGPLKGKFFEVGKKADDGNDFIVYNKKTGDLFYDKNGDKKGGAILFAHLEGSPDDVSKADFFVI